MGGDHEVGGGGACANCGAAAPGAFCGACGQATHLHRNLIGLVHDIGHGVFHFEGRIWHTLPLLAWHPGALTRRYIAGERAKFISPMALFLFAVFLMFAVVSNLPERRAAAKRPPDDPSFVLNADTIKLAALRRQLAAATDPAARAAIDRQINGLQKERDTVQIAADAGSVLGGSIDGIPPGDRVVHLNTGWRWLDGGVAHMSANPALTIYKMKTYGYKYSWALIPLSLPFIWLLFALRRDVGLYDHAIFSIYSLSFMSLAVVGLSLLSWIGVAGAIVSPAVVLIPPVHMYRQLKGAYRLSRLGALWRTVALLLITGITSSLFIAFLFWMGSH